ncbi:hypothetical protein KAFR_0B05780 [Kazachstania africana CBS 2517]|uniref:C3H1-type domain-containing protein n=1 Tax=Kazachstania africana (strain ATCC 22294 / BCRC 22015 / CBS 2517 / CECT 1963 / NBRC 1671 / NRRL Y-8276) TaxID=1071382 RepID=H2AR74_KAZAF|nr:hypothetical protein KAFR_0B05780 [Kazachstania africana CBS 2517]CCF56874.1 hypothetical protein KAFR_0B05780 [Kazachstania africana CBS 2517]
MSPRSNISYIYQNMLNNTHNNNNNNNNNMATQYYQQHLLKPATVERMAPSTNGSSSIFSDHDVDYSAKIREIEEYYMKNLLNEGINVDVGTNDNYSGSDLSSAPSPNQSFCNQPNYQTFLPQSEKNILNNKTSFLEVEINNAFTPSDSLLPLTTENLQRLSLSEPSEQQNTLNVHSASEKLMKPQNTINKTLFKTELCESFTTKGFCKYGNKCQFAHGLTELKFKQRSNNFRTRPCINWQKLGYCPYGKRCCFKHGDNRDIRIYVKAGLVKEPTESSQQPQKFKNLHPSIKELQRITW